MWEKLSKNVDEIDPRLEFTDTFYEQLLHAKIPKSQKILSSLKCLFVLLGSVLK